MIQRGLNIKWAVGVLVFAFFAMQVFAQTPSFTAAASKTKVAVGEQLRVTFTLNATGSDLKVPAMNDFNVLSGPNQSSSMQFVNGNVTQSISYSFIISAKKEGRFTIGPAYINSGGKTLETKSIVIEVVKGSAAQQQSGGNQGNSQQKQQQGSGNISDNLFLKISVDKTKAYIGEQIIATYKIYTRVNIVDNSVSKLPSLNGFWSQDVKDNSKTVQLYTENVDGVVFNVADLKKTILFPQRSGKLVLDPIEMEVVVRQRAAANSNSIFDQFFGGGYQDLKYTIKSRPLEITVLPNPAENKPASFNGAVGSLNISSSLDKDKVKANDAINLQITVSGKGNLKLIDPFKLEFPPDIETYDPKIIDNISTAENGVSGSKTFEYLLIPRHQGEFVIPGVQFSYFDPQKKSYVNLKTEEFKISVEKGDATDGTSYNSVNREEVKMLSNDIRYIKTAPFKLKSGQDYFFGSALFYSLIIAPFALFGIFYFIRRKQIVEQSNQTLFKSKRATGLAKKRLSLAGKYLKENNPKVFYEEVFKALYGYLSDKLSIPVSDLSKETISNRLGQKSVKEETIKSLVDVLNICEFARFAPSGNTTMEDVYKDAIEIISKIEEELK